MSNPDWGDFDDADAFDTEPADPEQVARKLHAIRRDRGLETGRWDDLDLAEQTLRIAVVVALLTWLRRSGALR